MQDLPPDARGRLDDAARRHGVGADAALALLRALAAGGGTMAQFSHPELGGMGQWSQGGMVMVGDMFDRGLAARVDALCTELAALLREIAPPAAPGSVRAGAHPPGAGPAEAWWPPGLGAPATSGAQSDMRYAYFPAARRLAIRQGGRVTLHDTGGHRITGASQAQGGGQVLAFSTEEGVVRLRDLPEVDAGAGSQRGPHPGATAPDPAPPPGASPAVPADGGDEALALIERLAELRRKGILTEEEFAAKKAELLGRL
jgi:Short C-terminal domain